MPAAVQVVELALRHAVVDVDSGEQKLTSLLHFVKALDTGGGLFGDAHAGRHDALPPFGVLAQVLRDGLQHELHLRVVRGGRVGDRAGLLELELSLVTLCVVEVGGGGRGQRRVQGEKIGTFPKSHSWPFRSRDAVSEVPTLAGGWTFGVMRDASRRDRRLVRCVRIAVH